MKLPQLVCPFYLPNSLRGCDVLVQIFISSTGMLRLIANKRVVGFASDYKFAQTRQRELEQQLKQNAITEMERSA